VLGITPLGYVGESGHVARIGTRSPLNDLDRRVKENFTMKYEEKLDEFMHEEDFVSFLVLYLLFKRKRNLNSF